MVGALRGSLGIYWPIENPPGQSPQARFFPFTAMRASMPTLTVGEREGEESNKHTPLAIV